MSTYHVITRGNGPTNFVHYYLRGTIWTSEIERANTYATIEAAQAAIAKSKQFNPRAAKSARIVEIANEGMGA
jgi:hypothetical protein